MTPTAATLTPTTIPTSAPTRLPTLYPSVAPTPNPTMTPTAAPTLNPTPVPNNKTCFNVHTIAENNGDEVSWTLGTCTSSKYQSATVYVEECCLELGVYTLKCMDSEGDGWMYYDYENRASALWIQGVEYCGDFPDGYSHSENITIITEPKIDNCFNITISTGRFAEELSWHLGHCAGAQQYSNHATYTEECCLEMGDYNLTCLDAYGDGWEGAAITIDGVAYCRYFSDGYIHQEYLIISHIPADTSTLTPTTIPTSAPTRLPTLYPSVAPTPNPTMTPTAAPTLNPTPVPNNKTCFNVHTITEDSGDEISWTLGTCTSSKYQSYTVYVEECCLELGVYTLYCMDSHGDGWMYYDYENQASSLWIQGVEYCGDFPDGYSHSENITIITEPKIDNCFNITISTGSFAEELSWHLGHCAGAQQYS